MGFAIAQVLVHPLAHRSGAMRVESTWSNDDIRAAHDLALIPLGEELAREPHLGPSHSWDARCMESVGPGVAVEFTAGDTERALTGHGQTLGHTDANALLGNGQMGVMLAVYGARPARGDSGSGLVAQRALLGPEFLACLSQSPMPNQSVLLGVVQNAPSFDDGLPFGVVPLYIPENASWLSRIAGETP